MPLPNILASVVSLLGLVALVLMANGGRREGRFGLLGLAVFALGLLLALAMLITRSS